MSDSRMTLRSATAAITIALALGVSDAAWAQVRAAAEVACQPASERLHYDCTIKLVNSRTGVPLSGVTLTLGADMPSMPAAHNVRPVPAAEDAGSGTYRARIALEMHGDWALRLDLSGAVRDRVIKLLRFESDRVGEPAPAAPPGHHRH